MVRRRTGRGSLGCLVMLLILAAVVYFGVNVGEVYWRFYQYQDAMRQEVRFAAHNSNASRSFIVERRWSRCWAAGTC